MKNTQLSRTKKKKKKKLEFASFCLFMLHRDAPWP